MALGSNMKGQTGKPVIVSKEKKKPVVKKSVPKKVTTASKKAVPKKVSKKPVEPIKKKPSTTVKKAVSPVLKSDSKKVVKTVEKRSIDKPFQGTKTEFETEKTFGLKNANLIIEPSKRKKIKKTKVRMEGQLNINNVVAFQKNIEPIFNDFDFVDFYLQNVTALDLTHIQLLYHMRERYKSKGKTVTIDGELPTELNKIVTNAGFKELMFIPKLV